MKGNDCAASVPTPGFSADRCDGAECRRLRLALGLNADRMATVAGMPGRWAWLSVEAGYEPIKPEAWALCLAALDEFSSKSAAPRKQTNPKADTFDPPEDPAV